MSHAISGTLTPDEVATVTITDCESDGIEIINRSQNGTIWYRIDGENPVIEGEGSHPVLGSRRIDNPWALNAHTVEIRLISDSALAYTVETDPHWVRR